MDAGSPSLTAKLAAVRGTQLARRRIAKPSTELLQVS